MTVYSGGVAIYVGAAPLYTRGVATEDLPNGCSRESAERALALYDVRRRGGYKNQVIAARDTVRMRTGMGVRDLRRWLAEHPVEAVRG